MSLISAAMIDPLYQKEILRLAAEAAGAGRLDGPDASVTVKNPLCGDQITLDINVDGDRVTALAHHTRACVLCQASAALLATTALGLHAADCKTAAADLAEYLEGKRAELGVDMRGFEVFAPVIPYGSRHTCVMLPFRALEQALEAGNPAAVGESS